MNNLIKRLICKLFGHKPEPNYTLEYTMLFDPPIGKLYCERCGELLDERDKKVNNENMLID